MKEHAAALHEAAMDLADQAFLAKNSSRSRELFRSAFEKEREAAEIWAKISGQEPTRSVLYRSAAALAIDCEDYTQAELLTQKGLSGSPPGDIAEELRELLEVVRMKSLPHLVVREAQNGVLDRRSLGQELSATVTGIQLTNDTDQDARVSVAGSGAGIGPRGGPTEEDEDPSQWPLLSPGGLFNPSPLPPGPWKVCVIVNGRKIVTEIRSRNSKVRLIPVGQSFKVKIE